MDEGFAEVKAGNAFKFGAPGDYIKGKYLGFSMFEGKFGTTKSHKVEAEEGLYHEIDADTMLPIGDALPLVAGATYSVIEKPIFAEKIAQAKEGQRLIVRFDELKKSKATGKNYKMINVKLETGFKAVEEVPFM